MNSARLVTMFVVVAFLIVGVPMAVLNFAQHRIAADVDNVASEANTGAIAVLHEAWYSQIRDGGLLAPLEFPAVPPRRASCGEQVDTPDHCAWTITTAFERREPNAPASADTLHERQFAVVVTNTTTTPDPKLVGHSSAAYIVREYDVPPYVEIVPEPPRR